MKPVFGDSLYFLALANPRDAFHERAVQFARTWRGGFRIPVQELKDFKEVDGGMR